MIEISHEMLKCGDNNCNYHDSAIASFHNDIVNACLIARSSSLPETDTCELLRRFPRKQSEITQGNKLAESMSNKRSVDFWNEIKTIKGTHKAMPGMVDRTQTEGGISQLVSLKYDCLYNSGSYDESDMSLLQVYISKSVSSQHHDSGPDCICKRGVSVNLVEQAMAKIQFCKTNVNKGCSSNHFKNGTKKTECIFFIITFARFCTQGVNVMRLRY